LAVLEGKAKKLGVSADVSESEAAFALGSADFDARLAVCLFSLPSKEGTAE